MAASDSLNPDQFKGWGKRNPMPNGMPGSWLAQSNAKNAVRARRTIFAAGTLATSGGAIVASHLLGY